MASPFYSPRLHDRRDPTHAVATSISQQPLPTQLCIKTISSLKPAQSISGIAQHPSAAVSRLCGRTGTPRAILPLPYAKARVESPSLPTRSPSHQQLSHDHDKILPATLATCMFFRLSLLQNSLSWQLVDSVCQEDIALQWLALLKR